MQILASGKTGAQRYDDNNVAKPVPDLDFIEIGQQTKRAFEETQGWSYSNNKGSTDSQATDLSIIEEGDVSDYDASFAQLIQTYVSNNSYLEVNGSSTANNIILEPRKIADVNSPNGTNYAKTTSLPFTFRDNLKFVFRATDTNTGAVQFSITGLSGLSGAIDSTNENGDALTGGEIVSGKFYEIITTGTATTKKVILRQPTVREASTTEKGTSYIPNPITISNGTDADHDIDFTAGNFDFDDGSGQVIISALTKRFDATFALGTGNGGMAQGVSMPTSGEVYHFLVSNSSNSIVDIIGDTSSSGANITADSVVTTNSLINRGLVSTCATDSSNNFTSIIRQTDKILSRLYKGASMSENGYIRIPIQTNVGFGFREIIFQWGRVSSVPTNGTKDVTLPLTFPNNFWSVTNAPENINMGELDGDSFCAEIVNTSTIRFKNNMSVATRSGTWIAIGN